MGTTGNLPFCTHRYAILVSYLGSRYNGSQRLTNRSDASGHETIQEALEWSFEDILPKKHCRITGGSRTDKGVHALMNCFTLPLQDFSLSTEKLKDHANRNLLRKNHDICIKDIFLVPNSFHPRRSAVSREYIYRLAVINNGRLPNLSGHHSPQSLMQYLPITELYKVLPLPCFNQPMAMEIIKMLRGKHDFISFSHRIFKGEDTLREMDIDLVEVDPTKIDESIPNRYTLYHLKFKSRAFLHNQIRRLVGAIVSYATYRSVDLKIIDKLLKEHSTWPTNIIVAEPWGLFLSRINYNRESIEGAIRTLKDDTEEKVESVDTEQAWSDDETENNEKELRN